MKGTQFQPDCRMYAKMEGSTMVKRPAELQKMDLWFDGDLGCRRTVLIFM